MRINPSAPQGIRHRPDEQLFLGRRRLVPRDDAIDVRLIFAGNLIRLGGGVRLRGHKVPPKK